MPQEYAFDVKLWAVARVTANSEAEARTKMKKELDAASLEFESRGVKLTEASIEDDDDHSELIEVDGVCVFMLDDETSTT